MFQFLLPLLSAMGIGGGTAALGGSVAPAATAAAGGTSALGSLSALGAGAGAAGAGGAVAPGIFASMFPNMAKLGTSAASGNVSGMGGALGNMIGGRTLGDMMENPSWANLGKMGEGMGDKLAMSMMTGGGQPTQQQTMGPGATGTKQRMSTAMPETDDPILQRMFQNLNQRQGGFQGSAMKPWPPSPYPKRMSAI